MAAAGPKQELRLLKSYVSELETHFIRPYLAAPTLSAPSRKEDLHVAAYVVLVHGAFENFIEGLSALDLLFNCGPESGNILEGRKLAYAANS